MRFPEKSPDYPRYSRLNLPQAHFEIQACAPVTCTRSTCRPFHRGRLFFAYTSNVNVDSAVCSTEVSIESLSCLLSGKDPSIHVPGTVLDSHAGTGTEKYLQSFNRLSIISII